MPTVTFADKTTRQPNSPFGTEKLKSFTMSQVPPVGARLAFNGDTYVVVNQEWHPDVDAVVCVIVHFTEAGD